MNKFLTLVISAVSIFAFGQHQVGIKSGVGFSQITNTAETGRLGLYLAANYGFKLGNNWILSSGIEYEEKGDKHQYSWMDMDGGRFDSESEFEMSYYSLPLSIGYQFGDRFFGSVHIGLVGRFLGKGNRYYEVYQNDELFSRFSNDLKDEIIRFDIGGLLELKGGYAFNDRHAISLVARINHGFMNIYKLPTLPPPVRNRGGVLAVGYTFNL